MRSRLPDSLIALAVTVVGAPMVWRSLASSDAGLEVVFFPVLAAAFATRAVTRR